MYALMIRENYDVLDVYETYQDAFDVMSRILEREPDIYIKIADTDRTSHLKVTYTELASPYGYGHHEISFETYGGIKECLIRLVNWVKDTERAFGPDWRDVRDYFRGCNIYINNQDKTKWFHKVYVDKIPKMYFA